MSTKQQDEIEIAARDARKAHRWELVYSIAWPVVCVAYWFVDKGPIPQRIMLIILAAWSGIALVASYGAKKEAALSKKAGYENP